MFPFGTKVETVIPCDMNRVVYKRASTGNNRAVAAGYEGVMIIDGSLAFD